MRTHGVVPAGRRGGAPARSPNGAWLVALPGWGARCATLLVDRTIPAVFTALAYAGSPPATLLIYSDVAIEAGALPDNVSVEVLPVPGPDRGFESLSNCHRDVLRRAGRSDKVLLLTADMVVSREVIKTCEVQFRVGKTLVCVVAPRTRQMAAPLEAGASGRELGAWAWANRHRMTRECTWPEGHSYDVWRMYFASDAGDEVVARAFLPHPLAAQPRGRRILFSPTIDVNLAASFEMSATHLITDPDEGVVVELSPDDKEFVETCSMRGRFDHPALPSCPQFVPCLNPRHRTFFQHRVVLVGTGASCGDEEVAARVLASAPVARMLRGRRDFHQPGRRGR